MPATKRSKPLYERGGYQLHRREGRTALEIVWYDDERKRERSASARTEDVELGRAALDRLYLEKTKGEAFCPTCGQRREATRVYLTAAIADYLTLSAGKSSIDAIRPRLTHVLTYLVEKDLAATTCDDVDEDWIERFRKWLHAKPIVTPTGIRKERSWSTVENSVLQLAAAVNRSGGTKAKFKAQQPKEVNQTPQHRSDLAELAAMFSYCVSPPPGKQPAERAKRDRASLLAFLRISVATMARPDAAHDISTDPARGQWNSARRILNLNPAQRRQTRKYRATVPVPKQMAAVLDSTAGNLITGTSVKSAWETMAKTLDLPGDGESGMKLIRRSVANIVRQRLPQEAWGELEMFLGHDKFDDVSDLYAPFRPDYLRRALAVVESIINELEILAPGAFSSLGMQGLAPSE
jgi:hypothetical protein